MKRSAKRYLTENQLDTNLFCHEKQKVRQFLAAKKARKSSSFRRAHGEMELEEDDDKECPDKQQQDESMMVLKRENPLNWKPFIPVKMKPKWWEMLCDRWAKDEAMKMSYQQRKNRYSGKHPRNTAGSPKITHEQDVVRTKNSNPDCLYLFHHDLMILALLNRAWIMLLVIDIDSHSPFCFSGYQRST